MNLDKLIKLIEQWAIDRGLDKNGTVEGQLIKTAEEVAELIIGISKDDIDVIKDSVGDVFVTLVVGNMLDNKHDFLMMLAKAQGRFKMNPESKFRLTHFVVHWLYLLLSFGNYTEYESMGLLDCLFDVCGWYELDLADCVESAYKEIADRKGKVINGTFWKSEDLEKWEEE